MTEEKSKKVYPSETPEARKAYYQSNRERILKMQQTKEECPICGRCVAHDRMKKHQRTSLCMRSAQSKQELTDAEVLNIYHAKKPIPAFTKGDSHDPQGNTLTNDSFYDICKDCVKIKKKDPEYIEKMEQIKRRLKAIN